MSKIALSGNASGTGTLTISAPNTSTDRTLTLPDNTGTLVSTGSTAGVSQAMLASGVAGNGPLFLANGTVQSAPSVATWTKLVFGTETNDTNSNYDTSLSRFQPTVSGYYEIKVCVQVGGTLTSGNYIDFKLYKTGAPYASIGSTNTTSYYQLMGSILVYMNGSTDYVEAYQYQTQALSTTNFYFQGFLARAA